MVKFSYFSFFEIRVLFCKYFDKVSYWSWSFCRFYLERLWGRCDGSFRRDCFFLDGE